MCHLYVPHTTAGVLINEGYDPDVARDMEAAFDRLVPHKGDYRHAEGNSDSHIKTALVGTSETVWIENGRARAGPLAGDLLRRIRWPALARTAREDRSRSGLNPPLRQRCITMSRSRYNSSQR